MPRPTRSPLYRGVYVRPMQVINKIHLERQYVWKIDVRSLVIWIFRVYTETLSILEILETKTKKLYKSFIT